MSEQGIPVLQEHQRVDLTTAPQGYTPNEDEKKTLALGNRLFEKAKKARKKVDEHWLDYYKMYRGKQWKEQRPTYRHSEVINFIFQAINSEVPIMTDSRPKFDFLPQEPTDQEAATILSKLSEYDWDRGNWLMKISENCYDARFYGTALGEMGYNPKARHGAGAITFDTVDPFHFFPDPNARDMNDDDGRCRYVIHAEPIDVEVLKREYPAKKDFIRPDLIDLMQGEKTDLDLVKYKSPVDNKTVLEGTSAYDVGSKDQALKLTVYCYSDEFVEEKKVSSSPEGQMAELFEQKLKFPNGRKFCMASGVLLDDGPIQYDDGLFPYARLINYLDPRSFWGISEIEQLQSPQKIFNKLVSFALDVLTLMGNPIWKVGTGSGVDTDNLFNRPGLIVEAEDINQVQREEGVQLQPYVLQLVDRMQSWFDGISGAQDITRGVQPTGVTAASAISDLQDAAQTRIRLKSRYLDAYLQQLGTLYKNRVFQFYTVPQVVRITNDQNAAKYFKFHVENTPMEDGTNQRKMVVRDYETHPETGEVLGESLQAKEYILRGDFDVKVTTGSSLPFAKTQKINLAFQLFDRQAIDTEELLKATDYPNYQAVMARMQAKAMEQAAQQAAMSAPPMDGSMDPAAMEGAAPPMESAPPMQPPAGL